MNNLWFYVLPFALVGCSSGGSSDSNDSSSQTDQIIVGIWDQTEDFGEFGVDEIYLSIDNDGFATEYDYDGDSFDEGENCYFITRNLYQAVPSGSNFEITFSGTGESILASAAIEGDELVYTALEDNAELDIVKGEKNVQGKKTTGLSATDFDNMECT